MSRRLTTILGVAMVLAMGAAGTPLRAQGTTVCAPPRACSSVRRDDIATATAATPRRVALDSTETGPSRGQQSLIGGAIGAATGVVLGIIGFETDGGCAHSDGACIPLPVAITILGIAGGLLGLIVGALVPTST
jgi:hypothetical protein